MKIDEFKIIKYGPLNDYGKTKLQNFNLFIGENEDGKTLTIDALTKLMFGVGKDIKEFGISIDRVDDNPEGYVIIRDSKNKLTKIPEKGTFKKNYGISSSECRNIFIIRNSDLSISSEDKFYDGVGARLMGLRTGELLNVKAKLRDIGKITPSNTFRNEKGENLKTRMDDSKAILESIDALTLEIGKEKLDKLEMESVDLNNELETVEQKIKLLEDANKRETYEKGSAALNKIRESLQNLKQVELFNKEDEQIWRDAQRDIDAQTEAKSGLLKELEISRNTVTQKNQELVRVKQNFAELTTTKQKLNEEIKPKITEYQTKRNTAIQQNAKSKFFTALSSFSAILLLASIAGIIIASSPLFFYSLAAVSGLLLAASLGTKLKYTSNKAQVSGLLDGVKLSTSKYDLAGENIEEILLKIQKFDQEYEVKSSELTNLTALNQSLDSKVNDLQDKAIPAINKKLGELNDQIKIIIGKSGTVSIEEYSKSFSEKTAFEKNAEQQETILESTFETGLNKREEKLAFWAVEIEELEEFKDRATGTKYSGKQENELKTKQSQIKTRRIENSEKLENVKEKMKTIERKASEVLRSEECIKCETSTDLTAIRNAIVDFVNSNENNKDNALEAFKIFEEIENEEKNKVATLFGNDSRVSEYFKEITNGLYKTVLLNTEAKKIQIERNDGELLDAEKLSAGTYDQLYLSIRLALGEKLLKGEKGFFIMDDPFIKADKKRLKNQLSILTRISQSGWQILYFSAKDEVREALQELIAADSFNLVETHAVAR